MSARPDTRSRFSRWRRWRPFLPAILLALGALGLAACAFAPVSHYPVGSDYQYSHTVEVQPGDTFNAIARRFNVSVDDLIHKNRAEPPFTIYPGDVLVLPKPSWHRVRTGQTLFGIAQIYGVDHERLARLNDLHTPGDLDPGTLLRIPGSPARTALPVSKESTSHYRPPGWRTASASASGAPRAGRVVAARPQPTSRKPAARQPAALPRDTSALRRAPARLAWPVKGEIIVGYGKTGTGDVNDGINVRAPMGTPVRAAESGTVIYRGNAVPGFGKLILVRHKDDLVTAYAHLGAYTVEEGSSVSKGQVLGTVGRTGSVSEPQLHFEVRRGVRAVDPMPYLGTPS